MLSKTGQRWLDVGCGTGALSTEIVNHVAPAVVAGIDASSGFIDEARRRLPAGIDLRVGDAQSLPFVSDSFDVVVSGIALNFVPDAELAVREMRRVARTGGAVGVYLWDAQLPHAADGSIRLQSRAWAVAGTL